MAPEFFSDDRRRAGTVEGIKNQIAALRAGEDDLRQQFLRFLRGMIGVLGHRPVGHRQIRPQIRRVREPKTPVIGLFPVLWRAVGIGVRRDHLALEHHGFDVEVIILGNRKEPDVFGALLPV